MFGFIRKRDVRQYMVELKCRNRKENMGANYEKPISDFQQVKNVYAQGYEDGTDNFYNALMRMMK